MKTQLNSYLSFKDNTRQAMEFYQTVFGGKLECSTFKEYQASQDSAEDNKIMHASLETDNGMLLMASDTPNSMQYTPGSTISLSLNGSDEAELRGYWKKLSADATITMPLDKAPWGDTFGMLTDKFGTQWMVDITAEQKS